MGKYAIIPPSDLKKILKKYLKKKKEMEVIFQVIDMLAENGYDAIRFKMRPHKLSGNYIGL